MRLIVNADDFGMTPGVTRGIVESMSSGIVSSTTLMVNMPSTPAAVALAHKHGLAVGLHLNLTTGRPVSPPQDVPSLVRSDGSFYTHAELRHRLVRLKVSSRDMGREFAAQIGAARRMGIEPTHLDTHHHLQLWFPVAWALLRAGRRSGIRKTRTTRTTDMAIKMTRSLTYLELAKRRYKAAVAAMLSTWFRMPTWRLEASAFGAERSVDGQPGLEEWLALIREVRKLPAHQTAEVVCHPGWVDDELRGYAKYTNGRQVELASLTSAKLKAALSQASICLVSFRDL